MPMLIFRAWATGGEEKIVFLLWWREGKCHITGYINSITQLAEAQGNDESDRGERTPGNGVGGGISGVLQVIIC